MQKSAVFHVMAFYRVRMREGMISRRHLTKQVRQYLCIRRIQCGEIPAYHSNRERSLRRHLRETFYFHRKEGQWAPDLAKPVPANIRAKICLSPKLCR